MSGAAVQEDPLDAFMATIEQEIVQQRKQEQQPTAVDVDDIIADSNTRASAAMTATTASENGASSATQLHPSAAQVAIAAKVAASRFCDVLGTDKSRRLFYGTARRRDETGGETGEVEARRKQETCLRLLTTQPAEFLRRFGHLIAPKDLDSFLPSTQPEVEKHVVRLRALMINQHKRSYANSSSSAAASATNGTNEPSEEDDTDDVDMTHTRSTTRTADYSPSGYSEHFVEPSSEHAPVALSREGRSCSPVSARTRNRRYRRLQQLADGGVWFSDEAMKERDPWLWHEHVGRLESEERPAPKAVVVEVPGSTTVKTYLQESLGFLSQRLNDGDWVAGTPPDGLGNRRTGLVAKGPALGMAFLSGMCDTALPRIGADGGGEPIVMDMDGIPTRERPREGRRATLDVTVAGDDVDVSYAHQTTETEDTAAVTAAVRRCSIEGDEDGGISHDRDRSRKNNPRVVHFVEHTEAVSGPNGGDSNQEEIVDDDEDGSVDHDGMRLHVGGSDSMRRVDDEEEEEEGEGAGMEEGGTAAWGRAGGREEVARILWERFLDGKEEGVDYRAVDADERMDDLDQLAQDEQERWFRSQEDDAMD